MSLFVDIKGEGQPIVLLHGWGMNGEVWQDVAAHLTKNYQVITIDLPGHGRSADLKNDFSLSALEAVISPHVPDDSILLGWSLGGIIAQQILHARQKRIAGLILVCSNAQFVADQSWLYGMNPEVLGGFMKDLVTDYKKTLQRFLMLQTRGDENAKLAVRELKHRLFAHGEPNYLALKGGLQLLNCASFVKQLNLIDCPTKLIFGKLDGLVPVSAAHEMANEIPDASLSVFDKSAHAPFISHPAEFLATLDSFILNLRN